MSSSRGAVQIVIPPRTLGAAITALLVITGIGLAYVYLPHATIRLHPKVTSRALEQDITLSTHTSEPDFVRFVLPAKIVEREVTEQKTVDRAANTGTHEDFAKGTVTLINEQPEPQELLPKTHLRHEASGVFFLTDSPVRIPPEGQIGVHVTAKEKGASGNVPAGRFIVDKLAASLQQSIYGESSGAFTGGVAVDSALSEAEIAQAKEEVQEQARQRAVGELTLETGGANVRPDLVSIETVEEYVSAQPGSTAARFDVSMKIRARAFVVDQNDLLSLTLLALRSNESADEEFLEYDPNSFSLEIVRADFPQGQVRVKGKLTGMFSSKIGPSALSTQNIAGLSEKEVTEHFEQLSNVDTIEVDFSPFWVTAVPSRPQAVEVIIAAKQTE